MDQLPAESSFELYVQRQSDTSKFEFFDNSLESVGKLYRDSKTADVHFTFESSNNGADTRIDAHKNLLAATSDVFGAMFYGEMKETGDIRVVDVSEAAFKEFLQYFYQRKVKLTAENVAEVMYLGHKYNVTKCVEDCITFFKRALNNENVCTALSFAILYDHAELVELCKKRIVSNTFSILNTAGFLKCDRRALEYILKMDFVSCSEKDVFEACMTWVKAKSGQNVLSKEIVDLHLGDLFYKIHFASMTPQELCQLHRGYDSVLSNDFITIANVIVGGPCIQYDKFITTPRQIKWNKNDILTIDRKKNGRTYSFDLCSDYETTLSSNVPLVLGSFVCSVILIADGMGGRDLDWPLAVAVKITETLMGSDNEEMSIDWESNGVVSTMTATLGSTQNHVLLPHPILIRPGFLYSICFGPFPCEHQYRTQSLKKKIQFAPDGIITFRDKRLEDDDDCDGEDVTFGLISEFNFNIV